MDFFEATITPFCSAHTFDTLVAEDKPILFTVIEFTVTAPSLAAVKLTLAIGTREPFCGT